MIKKLQIFNIGYIYMIMVSVRAYFPKLKVQVKG